MSAAQGVVDAGLGRQGAPAAASTLPLMQPVVLMCSSPPCFHAAETARKECPDTPATRSLRTAFKLLDFTGLQGAGDGQGAVV